MDEQIWINQVNGIVGNDLKSFFFKKFVKISDSMTKKNQNISSQMYLYITKNVYIKILKYLENNLVNEINHIFP